MFGPKKPKVSKKDLKKSIVNANDRLRAINARMELDIEAGKDKLKNLEEECKAQKKELEDTKELQVFAKNELSGIQSEIYELEITLKEALSKVDKATKKEIAIKESNEVLQVESDKLNKTTALLATKQLELKKLNESIKQIKKEERDGEQTLELLAIELNELESGVDSYISRKSAANSEFKAFKEKIAGQKATVNEELDNIKERMAQSTLACGKEMGRLDKAIVARIAELQEMETSKNQKAYELSTIQSKISSVEERVKDAEERIAYIVKREEEKVGKIKGDFREWKVKALDDLARKKIKGQIDNIDKAGLKEVLNG